MACPCRYHPRPAGLFALIWFAGPLIAFGDAVPLDSGWVRFIIIFLAWLIVGLIYLFRWWRARRNSKKLEEGLLNAGTDDDSRMSEALQTLKQATGKRDFLYDLPWYIIIGPPGAGKTTALLRSGLKFPLAGADWRRLHRRHRRHALLRLVVHRRGGAGRHGRPLHHPGFGCRRPTRRAGFRSSACSSVPFQAADQRCHRRHQPAGT